MDRQTSTLVDWVVWSSHTMIPERTMIHGGLVAWVGRAICDRPINEPTTTMFPNKGHGIIAQFFSYDDADMRFQSTTAPKYWLTILFSLANQWMKIIHNGGGRKNTNNDRHTTTNNQQPMGPLSSSSSSSHSSVVIVVSHQRHTD